MTANQPATAAEISAFAAGVQQEIGLLEQLQITAGEQRLAGEARDFDRFQAVSSERDRLTRALLDIESGLADTRLRVMPVLESDALDPGHLEVLTLCRRSDALVADILRCDREAMKTLADAEVARRAALNSLEKGETTLAAYRRVLTTTETHAGMLDQRG